jgi:predicted component of type VI protein secretion system
VKSAHVVIDGPGFASAAVELREGITTIGRLPANDVVLNDQQVSRHHARIAFFEHEATFQDLDSHNGSLVNDRRTASRVLEPGDVIRIGPFRLRFRIGPPEAEPTPRPVSRPAAAPDTASHRGAGAHLATLLLRAIDNTLVAPPKQALARTLAAVDQALHADRSALVRLRPDGRLSFVHGREGGQTHDLPSVQTEIVEWVVQRRFPVSSENPEADPRFSATTSSRPAACVPIGHDAELWGALYVERSSPSFSLTDLDGLQAVAHLVQQFLQRRHATRAPWRSEDPPSGEARSLHATALVLELAPPADGASPHDTVSDDPSGDPWSPGLLGSIAEAASASGGLWVGHDDRRVLLVFPRADDTAGETDLIRRLEPVFRQAKSRIGLAAGPVTVRDVALPGSTRLFASGPAVATALRYVRAAEWGALAAPADRAERLRAGGLRVRAAADGTLRGELGGSPVTG